MQCVSKLSLTLKKQHFTTKQNDKNKKQKKSIEWNSPEAILTMVEKVG